MQGTADCTISFVFAVHNTNRNYTMSHFVQGTYTIRSECLVLQQRYQFSWWHWPNQADFSYGYDIRNETIVLELPQLHPILDAGDDVEDLCGDFLYEFNNPQS